MRQSPGSHLFLVTIAAVITILTALAAVACGSSDSDNETPTAAASATTAPATGAASPTTPPVKGEIIVFAASSLTDAFKEAAKEFQAKNPEAKVTFNFAASSALATQINEGAPADVFASADAAQMAKVTEKGNASASADFVTNRPTVIVPASGSPLTTYPDLAQPGVRRVLAAPEAPIGKDALEVLAKAAPPSTGRSADFSTKVLDNLKSNEANVRAVLSKVQLGEADAGIVYTTDAAVAAKDVRLVEIPAAFNVVARYPMATIKASKNATGAQAWVAFIASAEGQAIMAKYGFGKP